MLREGRPFVTGMISHSFWEQVESGIKVITKKEGKPELENKGTSG